MTAGERLRGKPVFILILLLTGWLAVRVLTWEGPFFASMAEPLLANERSLAAPAMAAGDEFDARVEKIDQYRLHVEQSGWQRLAGARRALSFDQAPRRSIIEKAAQVAVVPRLEPSEDAFSRLAHRLQLSGEARPLLAGQSLTGSHPDRPVDRWSADAWLLLRQDTSTALTAGRPSYGRSQAGAVLRYRLAPRSPHIATAYVRVSRAVEGPADSEIAVGLAARPFAAIPASVAVELRAFDGPDGREARPAVFAVTELPPMALPLGTRGEVYVQGGYVGGEFATAFIDGQARIDRAIVGLGGAELRAGAAAWGGAQKGAERLDIGPSAALAFRIGQSYARAAVDYRFRVAGEAEPSSGPALTISASF